MKLLAGLLAFMSSFLAWDSSPKSSTPLPLNTAIIAFHETYFSPVMAEPGNFPFTKSVKIAENTPPVTAPTVSAPILPSVIAPISPPPSPPTPTPVNTRDPYIPQNIPLIDQSTQWLKMDFSLNGDIYDNAEHSLSNITIDREYWKVDIFAYWAPGVLPPKPPLEKDYFKLEIYDEGTGKLIYTMTSGNEENPHLSQIFKKAGKYTFKAFAKMNGKYEVNFLASPKMAQ